MKVGCGGFGYEARCLREIYATARKTDRYKHGGDSSLVGWDALGIIPRRGFPNYSVC